MHLHMTRHCFQVIQPMRNRYIFRLQISHLGFVNPAIRLQGLLKQFVFMKDFSSFSQQIQCRRSVCVRILTWQVLNAFFRQ